MYFAYGWPRVFAGIQDPSQRDIIYSSLGGQYLVVVSTTAIQIWSGGQERVRLGHLVKSQKMIQDEGENFTACWNGVRRVLAVLTSENILQLYGIRAGQSELFPGVVSQLGRSHELHSVDIFLSANIHIDTSIRATGVVGDSRSFLVSLSDGRFMLFSWQGASKGYADPLNLTRSPRAGSLGSRPVSMNSGDHMRTYFNSSQNGHDGRKGVRGSRTSTDDGARLRSAAIISSSLQHGSVPLHAQASSLSELSAMTGVLYVDPEFGELVAHMGHLSGSDGCHIWHMDYSEQLQMLTVVLLDGRVALCRTSEYGLSPPDQIKLVRWVCGARSGALYACIGSRAQIVAIGRADGQIALYTLTQGKSKAKKPDRQYASPTRVLSIVDWGHKPSATGGVSVMQWSPDCRALAVGWRLQGMAVWSPSGCRLMCSLRQKSEPFGLSRHDSVNECTTPSEISCSGFETPYEPLEGGIATMCWGPEGYQLLIAERGRPSQLLEINFAKAINGDHRVPRIDVVDSTRLQEEEVNVLQAADRLLLITESQDAAASSNWSQWNVGNQEANQMLEDLVVRHLRVPAAYMATNWPIMHAAVSADGYDIACAGLRGLALYSRRSAKWRLFGDVSQERSISVKALVWLPKVVVACVRAEGSSAPAELLLYPRYHLDNSSLLGRYPLHAVPLALDAVGQHLLVACAPLDIMVLKVEVKGDLVPLAAPAADITLQRELSIMSVGYPLLDIALVAATNNQALLHHACASRGSESGDSCFDLSTARQRSGLVTSYFEDDEPTHCVVLRAGGLLSVLDMERGSEVLLDNDVECFWLSGAILSQKESFQQNEGISTASYQVSTSSTSLVNLPSRPASSASTYSLAAQLEGASHTGETSPGRKNKRHDLQVAVGDNGSEEVHHVKCPTPSSHPTDDDTAEYAAVEMPWWAYGARGMQLWYPSSIAEPSTPTSVGTAVASFQPNGTPDPELEFDREVYPVGISLADAAIVGVTQRMQKSGSRSAGHALAHASYPLFNPCAESQPVLPCLLRRLLQKGAFDEAVVLARRHERGHYFPRSLEWLLFTCLEIEHENRRKAQKDQAGKVQPTTRFGKQALSETAGSSGGLDLKLMQKAVRLIRIFPQYSDVIVSVARKTDAALWPLLFSAVGSPMKLIQRLLDANALESAACCLLCVDRLEGADKAQDLSLNIIGRALDAEQYSLALELLRFVIPPTDADSIFETIDAEEARAAAAGLTSPIGVESPSRSNGTPQKSPGWFPWIWGSPSSDPWSYRGSCAAVITRPLTVVAPPKPLPEAPPVHGGALGQGSSAAGDVRAGLAAWTDIAEHARKLLHYGRLRSLAAMGRAMAAIGGGMPRLLIAARRRTGGADPRAAHDPGSIDLLSALAIVHAEFSGVITDPDAMADAVLLHEACVAAGYVSWAAALAMVLEHYPTLNELKLEHPRTWEEYSKAVRNNPSFAMYWRVLESIDGEISPEENSSP
uniref:Protein ric1 n=1 Tax=Tetraselmis sp. GSL018 TaxID=582737 RepID=A0A061S7S9_9CHLO